MARPKRLHLTCLVRFAAALVVASSTLGCRSMTHEVRIEATQSEVWEVLVDLGAYPEWNPFFVRVLGELEVGEKLQITMVPVGKKPQSFSPRVLAVDEDEELVWRGRLGVPGLFDGRHVFTVERVDERTVLFRQYERFSGLLVPFVGLRPYREGWARMDRALEARVRNRRHGMRLKSAD